MAPCGAHAVVDPKHSKFGVQDDDDDSEPDAPSARAAQPGPRIILRLPAKREPPADPLRRTRTTRAAAGENPKTLNPLRRQCYRRRAAASQPLLPTTLHACMLIARHATVVVVCRAACQWCAAD